MFIKLLSFCSFGVAAAVASWLLQPGAAKLNGLAGGMELPTSPLWFLFLLLP